MQKGEYTLTVIAGAVRTWQFNASGVPAQVLDQLNAYTDIPPHVKVAFRGLIEYAMLPKINAQNYQLKSSGTVGGPEYQQTMTCTHEYK